MQEDEIATIIRNAREKSGLTKEQFATKHNMTVEYLEKLESGVATRQDVVNDVRLDTFIHGKKEPQTDNPWEMFGEMFTALGFTQPEAFAIMSALHNPANHQKAQQIIQSLITSSDDNETGLERNIKIRQMLLDLAGE